MSVGGFQCLERVGDMCLKDISLFYLRGVRR